jgi:hypothetical protein
VNEDLCRIGDDLEGSIARAIAASATDDRAVRNNVVALRHVPVEHTNSPKEPTVSTATATSHRTAGRGRMTRRGIVAIAVLATFGAGTAAAAMVGLSSDDVSRGLPGGSKIFEGTAPSCTSAAGNANIFHCALANAPTFEILDDYTGTLEPFIDSSSLVAGGCISNTADGLDWTCYAGQLAVDKGVIGQELLGQHQNGPSQG